MGNSTACSVNPHVFWVRQRVFFLRDCICERDRAWPTVMKVAFSWATNNISVLLVLLGTFSVRVLVAVDLRIQCDDVIKAVNTTTIHSVFGGDPHN